ncbi:MerR family transcriptional regulator [Oceanobacter mangrovi]|uniref:MerR family transcriptional regulator n=1 Tax=Oceanobacter mangrovi TaxID=2862510 RepID=UPI001C8E7939|nr:MerR family transcriptional regulator [Oceanobacter mangrovi]
MQMREVIEATHLSRDTIRFYEKEGLIPAPVRSGNGYRHYDESVVRQLKLIKRAKHLGFTLKEIKSLAVLLYQNSLTPREMELHLRDKRDEIAEKIAELAAIKSEIDAALAGMCPDKKSLG